MIIDIFYRLHLYIVIQPSSDIQFACILSETNDLSRHNRNSDLIRDTYNDVLVMIMYISNW